MTLTLDRVDAIAYRIMRGDEIAGFALKLSNNRWGAFSPEDERITKQQFSTPSDVRRWFALREAQSDG